VFKSVPGHLILFDMDNICEKVVQFHVVF
jgi:hypothetical protein